MHAQPSDAHLRLVGVEPDLPGRSAPGRAEHDVALENRRAAINPALDPHDPRWVLAARVQSQLQGSMLTPERRDRILQAARQMGLSPFEASMIIALVQDQARRGGDAQSAAGTIAEIAVRTGGQRRGWPVGKIVVLWLSAALLAAVAYMLLAMWLLAG